MRAASQPIPLAGVTDDGGYRSDNHVLWQENPSIISLNGHREVVN
jgi:hypothetical protein